MIPLLIAIVLSELVIVFFLWKQRSGGLERVANLTDITAERLTAEQAYKDFSAELETAGAEIRNSVRKVHQLAAELESEITAQQDKLTHTADEILELIKTKLEEPMTELASRQFAVEKKIRAASAVLSDLHKENTKAQTFADFLSNRLSYDQLYDELENRRLSGMRL